MHIQECLILQSWRRSPGRMAERDSALLDHSLIWNH